MSPGFPTSHLGTSVSHLSLVELFFAEGVSHGCGINVPQQFMWETWSQRDPAEVTGLEGSGPGGALPWEGTDGVLPEPDWVSRESCYSYTILALLVLGLPALLSPLPALLPARFLTCSCHDTTCHYMNTPTRADAMQFGLPNSKMVAEINLFPL